MANIQLEMFFHSSSSHSKRRTDEIFFVFFAHPINNAQLTIDFRTYWVLYHLYQLIHLQYRPMKKCNDTSIHRAAAVTKQRSK